jgi:K+-transporting ATPase ATPase B chain
MNFKDTSRILLGGFYKLAPQYQFFRPIMFPIYVISMLLILGNLGLAHWRLPAYVMWTITILIFATVILSCLAETIAINRGSDQAESLKKTRQVLQAKLIQEPAFDAAFSWIPAHQLQLHDLVLVEAGELIPCDGQVIKGAASVNESAITGESAPVIRESGGDRSSVLAGTKVVSDCLIIEVTKESGQGFLDEMIRLVEGAKRQKMPSELMLTSFLAALTALLILVCTSVYPMVSNIQDAASQDLNLVALIALFVCLAPTTIGGLLPAIAIAGFVRMLKLNVLAVSGLAVEAAGNIGALILDKTGTITLGNRQATELKPAPGILLANLAEVALLTSLGDDTAEGKSIVRLCESMGVDSSQFDGQPISYIPFTAETRMSGATVGDRQMRKGAMQSIEEYLSMFDTKISPEVERIVNEVSRQGGTPLVVVENQEVLGVISLKDVVKQGLKERFEQFRQLGIKTIMVTGDNPLTAAAIAAEAGVDDFMANAKPQHKLEIIRDYQSRGYLVAMTGDGTNDAPALAQADVGLVMNNGTQEAKEAGNLIDLDSNPTKLLDIIYVGKILIMTRGALTTFSICNDVAKYFAVLPVILASLYPNLSNLNLMHLTSPLRAIIAALLANLLLMLMVVPLALKGIDYHGESIKNILNKNLTRFGIGGVITPFVMIKVFDMVFAWLSWF